MPNWNGWWDGSPWNWTSQKSLATAALSRGQRREIVGKLATVYPV
ncbi:MAG TPA: hypothetical protein VGN34_19670 [Ktedonobacteraceae bacterium]